MWRQKLFLLAVLGLSLSVPLAGRLTLPGTANLWGVIDDLALAAFVISCVSAATLLKRPFGSAAALLTVALLIVLSFANGWYFEFYRGFLELSSWHLLSDLGEAETSVAALFSPASLIITALLFAVFGLALHASRWPDRRSKLRLIAAGLGTAAVVQAAYGLRPSEVFNPSAESFLSRLGRQALSTDALGFTKRHTILEGGVAIANLIPPRNGWRVVDERYPLYQAPGTDAVRSGNRLNVILLVLEGVRASEMGAYGNPRSATPQLDKIARQGLFARQYYSNATQTIRAEVNLLCGVFDYLGGSPLSVREAPLDVSCLPEILGRRGYATYWFHGYRRAFFQRGSFFPAIGFQTLHDLETFRERVGEDQWLGWGIRDPVVYDHAINVLERETRPFFAEILSLSNHFPFQWKWGLDFPPELDGSDRELFYNYRRGIYYTDHGVGLFLERFRRSKLVGNTIVIIVGDHGIWTFDPKQEHRLDDFNRHEQYFRVPFIALGPGIEPETLDVPLSHVDVFPTILSWLGIYAPTATIGRAFSGPDRTLETRSVFTLVEGNYGYRRGETYCVPTSRTCSKESFPRCGKDERPSYGRACVKTKADPLIETLNSGNATRVRNPDLAEADLLVQYMQMVLREADFGPGSN